MKKILFIVLIALAANSGYTQETDNKKGVFKHFHIRGGFTVSYSHQFTDNWIYLLQADARVKLSKEHYEDGVPLSVVLLVPLDDQEDFNILFNLSIADLANSSNFFNTRIPFGIGGAFFPIKNKKYNFLGVSLFCNIGHAYRMRSEALASSNLFFPIADHPGYNLAVNAPVPEEVIKPFCYGKTTYSLNGGIILRF
jgi:hypothetical protein